MNPGKLFRVLVMGGAVLAAGCTTDDDDDGSEVDGFTPMADAATPDRGLDAAPGEDAAEPMECGFCPNEACCEVGDDGESREREGLVCCWGTSC